MRIRTLPALLVLSFAVLVAGLLGLSCASRGPLEVGLVEGRLAPCPRSPNCVSSQDPDAHKRVAPLALAGDPEQAFARLLGALREERGWSLERVEGDWAHFVFTSGLLGFRDDVELLLVRGGAAGARVELRSASRVGWWDLGANRARVERLRALCARLAAS